MMIRLSYRYFSQSIHDTRQIRQSSMMYVMLMRLSTMSFIEWVINGESFNAFLATRNNFTLGNDRVFVGRQRYYLPLKRRARNSCNYLQLSALPSFNPFVWCPSEYRVSSVCHRLFINSSVMLSKLNVQLPRKSRLLLIKFN